MSINIIAAIGKNRELGNNGKLLWSIPDDMAHFKKLTESKTVVMGHTTWRSIPKRFRPLVNRYNIVISRDKKLKLDGAIVRHSLNDALDTAKSNNNSDIYIIGGAQIYSQSLLIADFLYLTIVEENFSDADVFFPEYKHLFSDIISEQKSSDANYSYSFIKLAR